MYQGNYSLKSANGYKFLHRENKPLYCPHATPDQQVKQSLTGMPEMEIIRPQCGTYCALMQLSYQKDHENACITLTCGTGRPIYASIEKPEEKPETNVPIIHKL